MGHPQRIPKPVKLRTRLLNYLKLLNQSAVFSSPTCLLPEGNTEILGGNGSIKKCDHDCANTTAIKH